MSEKKRSRKRLKLNIAKDWRWRFSRRLVPIRYGSLTIISLTIVMGVVAIWHYLTATTPHAIAVANVELIFVRWVSYIVLVFHGLEYLQRVLHKRRVERKLYQLFMKLRQWRK